MVNFCFIALRGTPWLQPNLLRTPWGEFSARNPGPLSAGLPWPFDLGSSWGQWRNSTHAHVEWMETGKKYALCSWQSRKVKTTSQFLNQKKGLCFRSVSTWPLSSNTTLSLCTKRALLPYHLIWTTNVLRALCLWQKLIINSVSTKTLLKKCVWSIRIYVTSARVPGTQHMFRMVMLVERLKGL